VKKIPKVFLKTRKRARLIGRIRDGKPNCRRWKVRLGEGWSNSRLSLPTSGERRARRRRPSVVRLAWINGVVLRSYDHNAIDECGNRPVWELFRIRVRQLAQPLSVGCRRIEFVVCGEDAVQQRDGETWVLHHRAITTVESVTFLFQICFWTYTHGPEEKSIEQSSRGPVARSSKRKYRKNEKRHRSRQMVVYRTGRNLIHFREIPSELTDASVFGRAPSWRRYYFGEKTVRYFSL